MSAREVDRLGDSATTSKPRKTPPARMRNYRIVAEPRTAPDLHKLAQFFIGMALARADAEWESQHNTGQHQERSSDPADNHDPTDRLRQQDRRHQSQGYLRLRPPPTSDKAVHRRSATAAVHEPPQPP